MKLFVDTRAFIALTDADDENHKAAAFYKKAKEKGVRGTLLMESFLQQSTGVHFVPL